jgi:hypothetical protein
VFASLHRYRVDIEEAAVVFSYEALSIQQNKVHSGCKKGFSNLKMNTDRTKDRSNRIQVAKNNPITFIASEQALEFYKALQEGCAVDLYTSNIS